MHTTFQYGGTEGKRHRLREAMLFLDPPEYYNPPGKLVVVPHSIWVCRNSLNFIYFKCTCVNTHPFHYLSCYLNLVLSGLYSICI